MENILYTSNQYNAIDLHQKVMDAIHNHYASYTLGEKIAFKIGKNIKSFKNFMSKPQATALGLISFWAAFIVTYFMFTIALNTYLAYLLFAAILIVYTNLTFRAVDSLVKEAIFIRLIGE